MLGSVRTAGVSTLDYLECCSFVKQSPIVNLFHFRNQLNHNIIKTINPQQYSHLFHQQILSEVDDPLDRRQNLFHLGVPSSIHPNSKQNHLSSIGFQIHVFHHSHSLHHILVYFSTQIHLFHAFFHLKTNLNTSLLEYRVLLGQIFVFSRNIPRMLGVEWRLSLARQDIIHSISEFQRFSSHCSISLQKYRILFIICLFPKNYYFQSLLCRQVEMFVGSHHQYELCFFPFFHDRKIHHQRHNAHLHWRYHSQISPQTHSRFKNIILHILMVFLPALLYNYSIQRSLVERMTKFYDLQSSSKF